MSLLDDIGVTNPNSSPGAAAPSPAAANPKPKAGTPTSLEEDIGIVPPSDPEISPGFVDSMGQAETDFAKQIPRRVMQGLGGLADLPGNIWDLAYHPDEGPHPMAHLVAEKLADRLEQNVPELQTKGTPSPLANIGGAALEQGISGLPFGLETVVPSMLGGGAQQAAQEFGAPPMVQAAAGALGPLGPTAAAGALRRGVRGAFNPGTQDALRTFETAEVSPTGSQVGLGTNKGGATQATLESQPAELQASVEKANPPTGKLEGGEAFENGVKASRKQQVQDEARAFQNARNLIGGDTPMPATNTQAVGKGITEKYNDPELNDFLASTKAQQIGKVVEGSSQPTTQGTILVPGSRGGYSPAQYPQQGMTFDKLRDLRTRVGDMIDWSPIPNPATGESNRQLKMLYNAMGEDLEAGISKTPPMAQNAYQQAINLYKKNYAQREFLDSKIKELGGPEQTFKVATNSAALVDGPSQMQKIMGAMNPSERDSFRNALTTQMGYPKGAQGRGWDENLFRTSWQNMHPDVKTMIYGPQGSALRDRMDAIGDVLNIRQMMGQNKFTPLEQGVARGTQSGTSKISKIAAGAASGAIGAGAVTALAHAPKILEELGEHPYLTVLSTLGTGVALSTKYALGRALNNKTAMNWLAQASKAPPGMLPNLIMQLDKMGQTGQDLKTVINNEQDNGK